MKNAAMSVASFIEIESEADFACALCNLSYNDDIKLVYRALAYADASARDHLKHDRDCTALLKLLSPLCDPATLLFLPPYAYLGKKLIDIDGDIMKPRYPLPLSLSDRLCESFKFYFQNFQTISAQLALCQRISTAVFEFMFSHGIGHLNQANGEFGRVFSCRHVLNCPRILALISNKHACTGAISRRFFKAERNPVLLSDYECKLGLEVLTGVRLTAYQVRFADAVLEDIGWPTDMLEALFCRANEAVTEPPSPFVLNSMGVPVIAPPS
jgi:hypothetical protein